MQTRCLIAHVRFGRANLYRTHSPWPIAWFSWGEAPNLAPEFVDSAPSVRVYANLNPTTSCVDQSVFCCTHMYGATIGVFFGVRDLSIGWYRV
jgi:hypothetical protein